MGLCLRICSLPGIPHLPATTGLEIADKYAHLIKVPVFMVDKQGQSVDQLKIIFFKAPMSLGFGACAYEWLSAGCLFQAVQPDSRCLL